MLLSLFSFSTLFSAVLLLFGADADVLRGLKGGSAKHILLIVTDDQGLDDIGYMDTEFELATSRLDALAKSGVRLTRMYAQPTCSPSRACLLTGKTVNKVGLQDGAVIPGEQRELSTEFTLLPELLRNEGYHTVGIGKWHLGSGSINSLPTSRGFDEWYGNMLGGLDYYEYDIGLGCNSANPVSPDMLPGTWGSNCYFINGYDVQSNGVPDVSIQGSGKHYTALLADKAVDIISSHDPIQPMFMYLAPTAPHSPLQPNISTNHAARCAGVGAFPPNVPFNARQLICMMMAGVDDMVGDVMSALDDRNMLKDTLIVYVSDNGGVRTFGSKNNNLHGQKGSFFEGGVRVPAFISGEVVSNSKKLKGTTYDGLMHLTDLYATIAEVAGVSDNIISQSDGKPFLHKEAKKLHKDFSRDVVPLGVAGLVMGAPFPPPNTGRPTGGVVFNHLGRTWKYADFPNAISFYAGYEPITASSLGGFLHDLTNDPFEIDNLISDTDDVTNSARAFALSLLNDAVNDGVPSPIDTAPLPRITITGGPNALGCWTPDTSPLTTSTDCNYGGFVPFNLGPPLGNTVPAMFMRVGQALSQQPQQ